MLTRNPHLYSDEENARWCMMHAVGWCMFPMTASTDLMAFFLPFFEPMPLFFTAIGVTAAWCVIVGITKWVSIPVIVFDEWLAKHNSERYLFAAATIVLFFQGAYYKILFYLFFIVFAKYILPYIIVGVLWIVTFVLMLFGMTRSEMKARFDFTRPISERLMAKLGYQLAQ